MIVTRQVLCNFDIPPENIIVVNAPAVIVNGGVAIATSLRYKSLEELKSAGWLEDACAGELLMINENGEDNSNEYVIRLFDFSSWGKLSYSMSENDGDLEVLEEENNGC